MTSHRHQRGAALLIAMLTVALVATFAAAALWQQWRTLEVEAAERQRVQSGWILTGALDWSRLLLREDRVAGNVDHLAEPWAVPLQEARLSSFLAADKNNNASDNTAEVLDAFLSGTVIDLQSMLNINNLIVNGQVSQDEAVRFGRLFEQLGIDRSQLDSLTENLRFALDTSPANRSAAMAPLPPRKLEDLVWLGLPAATVSVLQPFVTLLPNSGATKVNVNTASATVIFAAMPGISMAQATDLVSQRERAPFQDTASIDKALGGTLDSSPHLGVNTEYFEVRARLRLEQLVVEERAQLHRISRDQIEIIQRQRGIVDPTALTRAEATR